MSLWGHEIRLAHDGMKGIEMALEFQPRIVLMDIGLPSMNGYDVCKRMREEDTLKDTIFIAQTGWGQQEHRKRSKEAGFHFHLVKPIQMEQLEELITYYTGTATAVKQ